MRIKQKFLSSALALFLTSLSFFTINADTNIKQTMLVEDNPGYETIKAGETKNIKLDGKSIYKINFEIPQQGEVDFNVETDVKTNLVAQPGNNNVIQKTLYGYGNDSAKWNFNTTYSNKGNFIVTLSSEEVGNCTVKVNFNPITTNEVEPNNYRDTARSMGVGQIINGVFGYDDKDHHNDIFRLEIKDKGDYRFNVTSDLNIKNQMMDFTVYNNDGEIIQEFLGSQNTERYCKRLDTGIYFIEIHGLCPGEYKFYVDLESKFFQDVQNHWAQNSIDEFVVQGYINGYQDGTFRPNNSITRAEFVTIVNGYFGLTKSSGKVFDDTKTHWAKTAIDIAVTNGVCNGKSATEFKPNDPITREEAAVMIANYKKIADSTLDKLNKYQDVNKVSSWAKAAVEGVIENGYMGGYSDNTFKPKNNITRAEAVVTLSRVK